MKIWIDLANSPHVNFFEPFIKDWSERGYDIYITTRDLSNTIGILKEKKWRYFEIGKHAGEKVIKKILNYPLRVYDLYLFMKDIGVDISIAHSSSYSPLVAKLIDSYSIFVNDNEYAPGNNVGFVFSDKVIFPDALKCSPYIKRRKVYEKKVEYFEGVKEGIYLSQKKNDFKLKDGNGEMKNIFFRPEPWTAFYYNDKKDVFSDLIQSVNNSYNYYLIPRNKEQLIYYKDLEIKNVFVIEQIMSLKEVYNNCDIFIGAGGTMTREMAVLGVPTISVYQGELLSVDKSLIKKGLMYHTRTINQKYIDDVVKKHKSTNNKELLISGDKAYKHIMNVVENVARV